jgi:glycosyltransferase involved in cell wall biosynthesis
VDNADRVYFEERITPLLANPLVSFVGEIGDGEKSAFLGGAAALLFPIDWPEPFGLVMIEAMACGTPVIAWDNGSVPEVVEDGLTGFIVRSEAEACAAIARLGELDRGKIRARFEERFSAFAMAGRYLEIYDRLNQEDSLTEAA